MAIDGVKPVPAISTIRSGSAGRTAAVSPSATQSLPVGGVDLLLSGEAQAGVETDGSRQDKTDALIASWFKHLSPANTEADKRRTAEEDHKKRVAQATGRSYSDPGRLPDPVKEPSQKTIVAAVDIIASDEIMHAMDPHKRRDDPSQQ